MICIRCLWSPLELSQRLGDVLIKSHIHLILMLLHILKVIRFLNFSKFNGEDSETTWEHVSQYLAQLGEAGSMDELKVRLFPLSLTGTAFSWFSALCPGSITTWLQLEQKFHDHLYSSNNELKLSHLTSVRQKHDESVSDYIKRFRDVKNRCYNLVIGERDLADLMLMVLNLTLKKN